MLRYEKEIEPLIVKEYTKTGRSCRVTFELPAEVEAESVSLLGDFNDWDPAARQLKRRKDGSFATTVSLKPGTDYRFRYLLDGDRWVNDTAADRHEPNRFGSEDSIICL
ncbi:MAG TPA: isoamylase early set domain-containing protein [Thermomicrobiaceae bacterium]|nr:isoamylase early set domain-containing protein [Thermomicrobiaceae bacterium]